MKKLILVTMMLAMSSVAWGGMDGANALNGAKRVNAVASQNLFTIDAVKGLPFATLGSLLGPNFEGFRNILALGVSLGVDLNRLAALFPGSIFTPQFKDLFTGAFGPFGGQALHDNMGMLDKWSFAKTNNGTFILRNTNGDFFRLNGTTRIAIIGVSGT